MITAKELIDSVTASDNNIVVNHQERYCVIFGLKRSRAKITVNFSPGKWPTMDMTNIRSEADIKAVHSITKVLSDKRARIMSDVVVSIQVAD